MGIKQECFVGGYGGKWKGQVMDSATRQEASPYINANF